MIRVPRGSRVIRWLQYFVALIFLLYVASFHRSWRRVSVPLMNSVLLNMQSNSINNIISKEPNAVVKFKEIQNIVDAAVEPLKALVDVNKEESADDSTEGDTDEFTGDETDHARPKPNKAALQNIKFKLPHTVKSKSSPKYPELIPAEYSKLVNAVKGKRFLVLQVENRVYQNVGSPLSESNYVPSIISMSRWAKKNNYAYLLYLSPVRAKDPWKGLSISHYWHKLPGMIFAHRIARAAGLSGVLYVDTDVSPDYLPIHDLKQNASQEGCTPRTVGNISTVWFPMRRLTTLEDFFDTIERKFKTKLEDAPFHFVLPPGHSTAYNWMTVALNYPKHIPIINAGVMFFRTTDVALARLRYWYLETIRRLSALEVAAAVGTFKIKNVTLSQYGEILKHNRVNFTQFKPLQDIYDFSVCTPIFRVSYEDGILHGSFQCRGKSVMMLRTFWDDICGPHRLSEIFRLPVNSTFGKCAKKPQIRWHIRHWPGDQGRIQELVLDDWGGNGTIFYIARDPVLSSPRAEFDSHLLYHWAGSEGKRDAGGRLSRYLMEQTYPDRCVLSESEWTDYAWNEVKSLPSFQLSRLLDGLNFVQKESMIFGLNMTDCNDESGKPCHGKFLEVLNVPL